MAVTINEMHVEVQSKPAAAAGAASGGDSGKDPGKDVNLADALHMFYERQNRLRAD